MDITEKVIEMRLIVEGAVALFQQQPAAASDEYSLIGEALFLLRECVESCLKAIQDGANRV